ncbi:phage portal protein family protein [Campylobacter jejuni]
MRILNKSSRKSVASSVDFDSIISALNSENFSELISIYDYFKRFDPQIASEVMKRRFKMCSFPMYINCKDEKQKEFLQNYLAKSDFRKFVFEMSAAVVYGFAAFLIEWKVKDVSVLPHLKYISPRFFSMDNKERLFFYSESKKLFIDECDDIFLHLHPSDSGSFIEQALFYNVISIAVLKQLAMSKNISYLDNLSVPPIIVKTTNANNDKEIEELLTQLSHLRSASVGIFNKEDMIELLNSGLSTSTFTDFLRYCDEAISKLISGQVLAGNAVQNGTQALGNIHEEVRLNVGEMDTLFLTKSIQKLLEQILKLNFATPCEFEFIFDTNKEIDEQYLAGVYSTISGMGYEIPAEFLAKVFKIEGLKKKEQNNDNFALNSLVLEKNNKLTKDKIELNANAEGEISDEIYEKIKSFWDKCESYEELEEIIFKEYPNISFEKLKESLDKKIALASMQALLDTGNE